MDQLRYVGKNMRRKDGPDKVTGRAVYSQDVKLPGTLVGRILRSPHPHARIVRIDTSRARALPGVKAVITVDDTKGIKHGFVETPRYPPGPGSAGARTGALRRRGDRRGRRGRPDHRATGDRPDRGRVRDPARRVRSLRGDETGRARGARHCCRRSGARRRCRTSPGAPPPAGATSRKDSRSQTTSARTVSRATCERTVTSNRR